jgi:dTDP-3,4-didehydro-2,6-dideoxy-alpha-D-glucose 3-reductase
MDILVIGVSNIFCRRVLPALLSLDSVDKIHLASSRSQLNVEIPEARRGNVFPNYDEALRNTSPCIAYVSLPNHLHAEWASKALLAGFHVIVDKPAFLSWSDTQVLLKLARIKNLCLAESNVWSFHPQVIAVQNEFIRIGSEPRSIQAVFSFPPLPKDNFRNNPNMGGGSFLDLGRYAVSPGRIFFGEAPLNVSAEIINVNQEAGVDTSFTFSAVYSRGRTFQGFFSFETEYKNSLSIIGKGMSAILEPAFTFPNSMQSELHIRVNSQSEILSFEPADSFAVFFNSVIYSISTENWMSWIDILEHDAYVMQSAQKSIKRKLK